MDNIYRGIVKKARTDSQSISLGEPTDDATFARDDLPSLEEPPLTNFLSKKLEPLIPNVKFRDKTSSPRRLRRSPTVDLNVSPRHESKFVKQKSEDHILINKKFSVNAANSLSDDPFEKHPRMFETKPELKITGGGSMFLKTHTKQIDVGDESNKKMMDKIGFRKEFHSPAEMKDRISDNEAKGDNLSHESSKGRLHIFCQKDQLVFHFLKYFIFTK